MLDEDDFLNPEETIQRYKLGINTDFLVRHFGQDDQDSSEEPSSPDPVGFLYSSI